MHLVQVFSLGDDLYFADDTGNPQVIALGSHKVRLEPYNGSLLRRIPTEVQHLPLKVTSECNVHRSLDVKVMQRVISLIISLLLRE
jgi:hypothetical protein